MSTYRNFLKHLSIVLITAFILVFILMPSAGVHANTFTVAAGDVAGLITAINKANDEISNPGPDTIELAAGSTYTLTAVDNNANGEGFNGLPDITSQITINGNGATITRSGANFRFFHTRAGSGKLTLNNLSLTNGMSAGAPGGAIYNSGSATLTINSSTLAGNTTGGNVGGAIFNNGGTVTITNSTLVSNSTGGGWVARYIATQL